MEACSIANMLMMFFRLVELYVYSETVSLGYAYCKYTVNQ